MVDVDGRSSASASASVLSSRSRSQKLKSYVSRQDEDSNLTLKKFPAKTSGRF